VEAGFATLGLAALAGLLTVLNPCVLPLLPMVLGAATAKSRVGLYALAAGMALAFATTGTALAASGQLLGLEGDLLRLFAAVLMISIGLLLLSTRLQQRFARAAGPVANFGQLAISKLRPDATRSQFFVGSLLGLVWTPCVGPTLGAAIALASMGEALSQVALVMVVFALAAVTPLVAVGLASRAGFARRRESALRVGAAGKALMGWGLLVIGLLVLSGGDKWVETLLLDHAPDWLITLTTRF
jgi:cytochrome c-type biogenesis protein